MPVFEVLIPIGPRKRKFLAISALQDDWQRHRLEFLATVHPDLWSDIKEKIDQLSGPDVYDERFNDTVQQALDEISDPDLDADALWKTAFFYFNDSVDVRLAALSHPSLTDELALCLMRDHHIFDDENAVTRIQREIEALWKNPVALLGLVSESGEWSNVASMSVKAMIAARFVERCVNDRGTVFSYESWIVKDCDNYFLKRIEEALEGTTFPLNVNLFSYGTIQSYEDLKNSLSVNIDSSRPMAILPYLEAFWPLFTGKAFGYPLPGADVP